MISSVELFSLTFQTPPTLQFTNWSDKLNRCSGFHSNTVFHKIRKSVQVYENFTVHRHGYALDFLFVYKLDNTVTVVEKWQRSNTVRVPSFPEFSFTETPSSDGPHHIEAQSNILRP